MDTMAVTEDAMGNLTHVMMTPMTCTCGGGCVDSEMWSNLTRYKRWDDSILADMQRQCSYADEEVWLQEELDEIGLTPMESWKETQQLHKKTGRPSHKLREIARHFAHCFHFWLNDGSIQLKRQRVSPILRWYQRTLPFMLETTEKTHFDSDGISVSPNLFKRVYNEIYNVKLCLVKNFKLVAKSNQSWAKGWRRAHFVFIRPDHKVHIGSPKGRLGRTLDSMCVLICFTGSYPHSLAMYTAGPT